jgi:hypothetical protein
VSGRQRFLVLALVLAATLGFVVLVAFAGNACPGGTATQPCPDAGRNRTVVVGLAAVSVAVLVTPFAFLAEFVLRRRIVYRGAWRRAARRGLLAGVVLGALAGLRLGGALSVSVGIFILLLAGLAEWFAIRRIDVP